MKLTKVDWREIKTYKATKLDAYIDEFIKMNTEAVEVTGYAHSTAGSCYNSFKRALERRKVHGIDVKVTNGRVFLLNTDLLNKHKED